MNRGAGRQLPEEVHHADIAREHLEHHVALIAKVPPARPVMHVSPDNPDRIFIAVDSLGPPNDAGRLVELHLLNDHVDLTGLFAGWNWRGFLLRERGRTRKKE